MILTTKQFITQTFRMMWNLEPGQRYQSRSGSCCLDRCMSYQIIVGMNQGLVRHIERYQLPSSSKRRRSVRMMWNLDTQSEIPELVWELLSRPVHVISVNCGHEPGSGRADRDRLFLRIVAASVVFMWNHPGRFYITFPDMSRSRTYTGSYLLSVGFSLTLWQLS